MEETALLRSLQEAVPGVRLESAPSVDLQTTVYVPREDLLAVARELRDRADLGFKFLAELTAVDFWPREPRFELVYLLVSIERRLRLRVKVRLSGEDARAPTVSGLVKEPEVVFLGSGNPRSRATNEPARFPSNSSPPDTAP